MIAKRASKRVSKIDLDQDKLKARRGRVDLMALARSTQELMNCRYSLQSVATCNCLDDKERHTIVVAMNMLDELHTKLVSRLNEKIREG